MKHLTDEIFQNSLNSIKVYGVDINEDTTDHLYKKLNFYGFNSEFPIRYMIRELGGKKYIDYENEIFEYLSKDISAITYEDFFVAPYTLTNILEEINRITKGNFEFQTIEESEYDPDEFTVTITFKTNEIVNTVVHYDYTGAEQLNEEFLTEQLFPIIRTNLKKGKLIYWSEFSMDMIYFENEDLAQKFINEFSNYKEI
jgi:hypothetical protein